MTYDENTKVTERKDAENAAKRQSCKYLRLYRTKIVQSRWLSPS